MFLQAAAELGEGAGGLGGVDGERVGHAGGGEAVDADRAVADAAMEQVADLIDHFDQPPGGKADEAVLGILTGQRMRNSGRSGASAGGRSMRMAWAMIGNEADAACH